MRTQDELYVLGAVARREVFRDWEGDQVWPIGGDPQLMSPEQAGVLARFADVGLVVLGDGGPTGGKWWELTDKALEG